MCLFPYMKLNSHIIYTKFLLFLQSFFYPPVAQYHTTLQMLCPKARFWSDFMTSSDWLNNKFLSVFWVFFLIQGLLQLWDNIYFQPFLLFSSCVLCLLLSSQTGLIFTSSPNHALGFACLFCLHVFNSYLFWDCWSTHLKQSKSVLTFFQYFPQILLPSQSFP